MGCTSVQAVFAFSFLAEFHFYQRFASGAEASEECGEGLLLMAKRFGWRQPPKHHDFRSFASRRYSKPFRFGYNRGELIESDGLYGADTRNEIGGNNEEEQGYNQAEEIDTQQSAEVKFYGSCSEVITFFRELDKSEFLL